VNLVEKHLIKNNNSIYKEIDHLAFLSKNLYNCGIYLCRQALFSKQQRPNYLELYNLLKSTTDYKALPAKVSQWVLKQVDKAFLSYEETIKEYDKYPDKFTGKPKLPRYKHKLTGRNVLIYTCQAVSKPYLINGVIKPSKTGFKVKTKVHWESLQQVRIVPLTNAYRIEVIYSKVNSPDTTLDTNLYAGVDLGLNNLATVMSNAAGFRPLLICGKAIKACNQYYNKQKARLQSLLPEGQYTSRRIEGLTLKRNNKVDYYLHTASSYIVKQLAAHHIGTVIIGKNQGWKQEINIGKRNNQHFVNIPHARFIEQIRYKAELAGICVLTTEESYTSKCSLLDLEPIQKHKSYLGRRVHRGLFRSSSGVVINADCNGAGNILRKVVGDSLFIQQDSIERCVVHPVRVKAYKDTSKDICP
jgi:IS605 OrfB family transposase